MNPSSDLQRDLLNHAAPKTLCRSHHTYKTPGQPIQPATIRDLQTWTLHEKGLQVSDQDFRDLLSCTPLRGAATQGGVQLPIGGPAA